MTDTRLPRPLEEFLLDVAADHSARDRRRILLGFDDQAHVRDAFIEALLSSRMDVAIGISDDDPEEVAVQASGLSRLGVEWHAVEIMPLHSSRLFDDVHQDLADDVIEHWGRLRLIAATVLAAA